MPNDPDRAPVPPAMPVYRRVALWVCALFVLPVLCAASGAMAYYGLYRSLVTGKVVTTSRGWQSSSSTIYFADSPVSFVIFYVLTVLLTAMLVVITVLLARLVFKTVRPARGPSPIK
ncbi:MAG: hypothetical protein EOO54_20450 [Haliea sp.]|nr:MAG: hypothetical protein EOO54_20450 [Haliea sp.]